MKKVIKVLCLILVVALLVCTAACGNKNKDVSNQDGQGESQQTSSETSGGNSSQGTSSSGNNSTGNSGNNSVNSSGNSSVSSSTNSSTGNTSGAPAGPSTYKEEKYWAKVNPVSKPSVSSGNMTLNAFEKVYRPYTEWRIYQIRTATPTVKPSGNGRAFYVSNSGNNKNDGLSPSSPLKDYAGATKKGLRSGDVIYFERGGTWRGRNEITTSGITISAYGEGKAPQFFASPENGSGSGCWKATDVKNVYEYKKTISYDVGAIIFDNKYYSFKSEYKKESVAGSKDIKYVNSYKDLKQDLQLYHDIKTYKVYIYSEHGNPSDRFNSIEFNISTSVFAVNANNITFDGICVKFTGAHGIGAGTCNGLTVRNCEFGWIGGGKAGGITAPERYGNAIEIWGGAVNYTVENNYIYQIYDAGITFQFTSDTVNQTYSNIKFNNNVIDYCNYSIEYFVTTPGDSKIKDFEIDGNLMWYAGDGLCSQRPDRSGSNHIKSWQHNNNLANQIKVTNNLFAVGVRQLCETLDKTALGAAYDKNIYVQTANRNVARNGAMGTYFKMNDSVKDNIQKNLGDKNAVIIKITN